MWFWGTYNLAVSSLSGKQWNKKKNLICQYKSNSIIGVHSEIQIFPLSEGNQHVFLSACSTPSWLLYAALVGATFESAEALKLHHRLLFSTVPTAPKTKEVCWGKRKRIPSGPGIPVCSFCYPLMSQTKGPGWTKGEPSWVFHIFSLCQSHFLFFFTT